jgi:polyribonucleotide nucleotidyltransferase
MEKKWFIEFLPKSAGLVFYRNGKIAKQADGAAFVSYGILSNGGGLRRKEEKKAGISRSPSIIVKIYALGKSGRFFKREEADREEVLTKVDRSASPALFPETSAGPNHRVRIVGR